MFGPPTSEVAKHTMRLGFLRFLWAPALLSRKGLQRKSHTHTPRPPRPWLANSFRVAGDEPRVVLVAAINEQREAPRLQDAGAIHRLNVDIKI